MLDEQRPNNTWDDAPSDPVREDTWFEDGPGDPAPSGRDGQGHWHDDRSELPPMRASDLDPRWSVEIGSTDDHDFASDVGDRDDDESNELDDWPVAGGARRAWNRFRAAPVRIVAAVVAVALVGLGLRFILLFDDGDDLAAVGLDASSTTSPSGATPTTAGVDALAQSSTSAGAPRLPSPSNSAEGSDATASTGDAATPPGDGAEGAAGEPGADPAATGAAKPGAGSSDAAPGAALALNGDYASNLALLRGQTVRNRNEDDSPYRNTPSAQLVPENHYGPRAEYLATVDGNTEPSFPVPNGGQFRVACEFSHFAYDDPLVFPNQPGASHLHMFFGNTDTNAFSTADSIRNTGGATCNGSELNRTAYWVPALFDNQGSVRVPERIVIYYKGEGLARGKAEVFPEGAAMIASVDLNTIDPAEGGARGKFSYNCANNYSGVDENLSNTMPVCDGNRYIDQYGVNDPYMVLEVNVKFPQCWNGQDPSKPTNFSHPRYAGWYGSVCDGEFNRTLVNLEYFVNYRIEPGETTTGWYLASDVSPTERALAKAPGSTIHGDWWGGWHKQTNQMFIDNCVNYQTSTASGCGFGYLTDGGPNNAAPYDGPALKLRDQYLGPLKVASTDLYRELCPNGPTLSRPAAAAYCNPVAPSAETSLFCNVHKGMYATDPRSPLNA